MQFHQRFVPGLAIASYIVGDEKSGEATVIDPTKVAVSAATVNINLPMDGYASIPFK